MSRLRALVMGRSNSRNSCNSCNSNNLREKKCCECDTLATKQGIIITVIQGGPARWKDPDSDLLCQRGTTIMYARHLGDKNRFCHFWESSIKLKSLNPRIFLYDRYHDVLTGFVFASLAMWLRWPMRVRLSTLRILRPRSRSGLVGVFTLVPHQSTQTPSTRPTGRRLYRKGRPRKSRTSNHQVPDIRHRHPNTSQPQIDL